MATLFEKGDNNMKNEEQIVLTDEEIQDEFSDVIEQLIADQTYKLKKYAIQIIREIINSGTDRSDHGQILYIISQVDSVRNSKNIKPADSLAYSSNKRIVKEVKRRNKIDDSRYSESNIQYEERFEGIEDIQDEHDRQNRIQN